MKVIDPARMNMPGTGIYVRAKFDAEEAKFRNADIAQLDRASLIEWLRSDPHLAEAVVLSLLGHDTEEAG